VDLDDLRWGRRGRQLDADLCEGRLPGRRRIEIEEGPPSMPVAEPTQRETP
jgi:hypothetical protein